MKTSENFTPSDSEPPILPSESTIAERAYEIYLENNCQDGYALDHWLQAEYELMQLPLAALASLPKKPGKSRRRSQSIIEIAQTFLL